MKIKAFKFTTILIFQLMVLPGCGPHTGTESGKENEKGNNNEKTDNNSGNHANTPTSPAGNEYPGSAGTNTITDTIRNNQK